jgi:hypothetical protein
MSNQLNDNTSARRKITVARETLRSVGGNALAASAGGENVPTWDDICLSVAQTIVSLAISVVNCETMTVCFTRPSPLCGPLPTPDPQPDTRPTTFIPNVC